MKIAILYICTGKYSRFFSAFYAYQQNNICYKALLIYTILSSLTTRR